MNVFHRSFALPPEAAPEEKTSRQELRSWSHYDASTDETAVVTLSVLVSTRITLTHSGSGSAGRENNLDGFVGCEWRFLLLPRQSSTVGDRASPVHARFCFLGCLPPSLLLRGESGVVFLDARRVLVLACADSDDLASPSSSSSPAMDYFSVQTQIDKKAPRWVRARRALPLRAMSVGTPSRVETPLLVTPVRQTHSCSTDNTATTTTEVLCVVASPSAGADAEARFDLSASVLCISTPHGASIPSARCTYTCSERGIEWPDTQHSETAAASRVRSAPQDWEWAWVPGQPCCVPEASQPLCGALITIAPRSVGTDPGAAASLGPWSATHSFAVCGGSLDTKCTSAGGANGASPHGQPGSAQLLAVGVVTDREADLTVSADLSPSSSTEAIMSLTESQRDCIVRLVPIGTPTMRLSQTNNRTSLHTARDRPAAPPFLLYWVLDCAVSPAAGAASAGPPPTPGLYVTDVTRGALQRLWQKGDLYRAGQPIRESTFFRVSAASTWSGLHPINLSRLCTLLPSSQRARVTRALSPTSLGSLGGSAKGPGENCPSSFRCWLGTDDRQTCLHCFYAEEAGLCALSHGAGESGDGRPSPLLVYNESHSGDARSMSGVPDDDMLGLCTSREASAILTVEALVHSLLDARPPLLHMAAEKLEHWAWDTICEAVQTLWRWVFVAPCAFSDGSGSCRGIPMPPDVMHSFLRCLDLQLMSNPFGTDSASPCVHGRHVVMLAFEALERDADPTVVEAVKVQWESCAGLLVWALCAVVAQLDALASERHHAKLVQQLLLLLLGSGTRLEEQRVHSVVHTRSHPLCSPRRMSLLFLYAIRCDSDTALEMMVGDIVPDRDAGTPGGDDVSSLSTTIPCATHIDDDDNEGQLMMMEYALLQDIDEVSLFHTLQRLCGRKTSAASTLASTGVLDARSIQHFFESWMQSHLTEVVTPSLVSIPFFVECCVDGNGESDVTAVWSRWASVLVPEDTPLCLPDAFIREEITDWSLFPWCSGSLSSVLECWRVLVARWREAVLAYDDARHTTAAVVTEPLWVKQARRHWPVLVRISGGIDVLQALASINASAASETLDGCLRHAPPRSSGSLSSWAGFPLSADTPRCFAVRATDTSKMDRFHEDVLSRLFRTAVPWRCATSAEGHEAETGTEVPCAPIPPPSPLTQRTLAMWEAYVLGSQDHDTITACADTVLSMLTALGERGDGLSRTPWILLLRASRCIYLSLLPRLLAASGAEVAVTGGRRRPAGECCQRLLHCLQCGGGGEGASCVPQWELLQRLTALQPPVADLVSITLFGAAPGSTFSLSFPSLFATACLAGNRRALVTLVEALRLDVSRFVRTAFHLETAAKGGSAFASAEAAKTFINDQSNLLDPHVDVLSQCRGGDPICDPLLRLLFLECVHDSAVAMLTGAAASHVLDCVRLAVERVCASLRSDDRRAISVALRVPFRGLVVRDVDPCTTDDAGRALPNSAQTLAVRYDANSFHQLVHQRLVPQIEHMLHHHTERADNASPSPGPASDALLSATVHFLLGDGTAAASHKYGAAATITNSLALLQQEEAFLRRRLVASLWTSYAAFVTSAGVSDALQQLYMALRLESYRRALLNFAVQQKDMCYTLVSANLLRVCSAFREQQRRLSVEAGERMRSSHDQLLRDEKRGRALLEDAAVDELQRLYLSALYPVKDTTAQGQRHAHPQPHSGDYVAEAGSAILGAFSKLQKRLVDTVAPPPKHTPATVPVPPVATPPGAADADSDGWGWASDDDDFAEPDQPAPPHRVPVPSLLPEHDDGWGWSETATETPPDVECDATGPDPTPPSTATAALPQPPPQETNQWGWTSDSASGEEDDAWDWPTDDPHGSEPHHDEPPQHQSVPIEAEETWDWPTESATPLVANAEAFSLLTPPTFDAEREVKTARQQRQVLLASVL